MTHFAMDASGDEDDDDDNGSVGQLWGWINGS